MNHLKLMAFLEPLGDEPHGGSPHIDDEVALPGGEEFRPAAHHIKPLEGLQRLSRAEHRAQILTNITHIIDGKLLSA